MTLTTIPLPFGIRDIKLQAFTDSTCTAYAATKVDLPNGRTLSFTETEEFQQLRGDDKIVASHGSGPSVEWELEGGGVSLEAVLTMYGGAITTSGTTPNQIKTLTKLETDQRPYFRIEGQAISDSGGDLHCIIYRARATDNLEGEFKDGEFFLTGASGEGYGALVSADIGKVWAWVQNETATAIA
jgi:hypothetical protein